ncbi:MAG: hypothetical protein M9894_03030 [Planctomycetes bacterium]|nr:hypothetical protein [Planctomycetota bacterium]
MSDDVADIIPRPPSSPIGSTMLIVNTLAMILAISVIWAELFGEYLPTVGPGQQLHPEMSKHASRQIAEKHVRDHYAVDFGSDSDILASVERDLQVSSKIGDLSGPSGGGGGGGGVEAPDGGD